MRRKRTRPGESLRQQPGGRATAAPSAPPGTKTRTAGELVESLVGVLPEELVKEALADPTNKTCAREVVAAGALRHYLEVLSRAYGGEEVSERHAKQIDVAAKLYAVAVGNLRERESQVPVDPEEAFLVAVGERADGKPAAKLVMDMRKKIAERASSDGDGRPN